MGSERTQGHPLETLPMRGLQFPQCNKLSAVAGDPKSEAVRDKGPGPGTWKGLWEMDSRGAAISEQAVKASQKR